MAWWLVYRRDDGTLLSESSVDPHPLPPELACVQQAERPDFGAQEWDAMRHVMADRAATTRPTVTISTAGAAGASAAAKTVFQHAAVVYYRIRIAPSPPDGYRTVVPLDRLDANGSISEPAAAWMELAFRGGVATGSVRFPRSGRYGVGPHTSDRFAVPEHAVTVLEREGPK